MIKISFHTLPSAVWPAASRQAVCGQEKGMYGRVINIIQ